MGDSFPFDVFLSHSTKDKGAVRTVAERLRSDGLRVWFDEWELKAGDNIPAKVDQGLEHSRVLVLCMSANAFESDWAQLEAATFRFRDPLNKERRLIPLRLDDAPIKGSLAQFLYVNWLQDDREQEYAKLLEACRGPAKPSSIEMLPDGDQSAEKTFQLKCLSYISVYAFNRDGTRVITAGRGNAARLWNLKTGYSLRVFEGHTSTIATVALSADQRRFLSGSFDDTVRIWDVETGSCLRVMKCNGGTVRSVVWSTDQHRALCGSDDDCVRILEVKTGRCLRVLEGHTGPVRSVAWSNDQHSALSGSSDNTVRLWDLEAGRCLRVLEGHTAPIRGVAWSSDQHSALSVADDRTVRLWDMTTGNCLHVLKGHTGEVLVAAWSADGQLALSGSMDETVRLWDITTGRCLGVFGSHRDIVVGMAWSVDQHRAFSGDAVGGVRVWDLRKFLAERPPTRVSPKSSPSTPDQVQYTNAKVLLVGDTSAGKTGLSMRLALNDWKPSDSTVGAWATHWKLPVSSGDSVEREIWLWDFGGQADQRLIHQLYMEDTALAVLVFDGQKEDLFETLGQWDRDLTRASRKVFTKLLVAGRVDAGGPRVSRAQLEAFANERRFACYIETSAKANIGCEDLKKAILAGIRWADIPWRSSPLLFKRLKEEIVRLKDWRVLMRFNEIRDALHLRLAGEDVHFKDEELKAVMGLLNGPGVVWELAFGNWVLLQPERINAYGQAVIQTLLTDEHERGAIAEERVLSGDLKYYSSMQRLEAEDERFVLLAMHQTLVERGLCLREHTEKGTLLIFPSYYRRERPELVGHPAVLVSYSFHGFLDDIYATLVVRLHHTKSFQQDQLWRYAADFKTLTGKHLGIKLTRRALGVGELDVYFDPAISVEEKIIFSRYIHEHLLQKGLDVVRLRHYVCQNCGTTVGNREVAMRRLEGWLERKAAGGGAKTMPGDTESPTIICTECEERIPLWDELEQWFTRAEIREQVRDLQEQVAIVLDNASKERTLVGEVISTVALAGQISREFNVSDHDIDMEIEFKDNAGEPTGKKLYLQLKSGDSSLRKRQRDDAELFAIRDERHARYWMAQPFPVLLLIRSSGREVRWMEVRDYLKRASNNGRKAVRQIVFDGERFDVMSVRRWRDKVLGGGL